MGQKIRLSIWDTAGQEVYHSLARVYYKDAKVAICVYDISMPSSFDGLKRWVKELKDNGDPDIIIFVVGNKIDLESDESIPYPEVADYAKSVGAIFRQTSAKENKGLKELFQKVASEVVDTAVLSSSTQSTDMKARRTTLSTQQIKAKKEDKKCCQQKGRRCTSSIPIFKDPRRSDFAMPIIRSLLND
eukprot:TRINITY_DN7385_c0_g1_i2.p1 TRINITY_DN7385_c0_g1~~TRINITY_DN7385_c0_g1_i2.p1  ORF type:complete len:188 (+),score=10.28 TRINITY_DN7385_c0_g1_i2:370-933(+)